MKKELTSIWLIVAMFVLPCILNLEKIGCIVFVAINIGLALRALKKYNPEYFI